MSSFYNLPASERHKRLINLHCNNTEGERTGFFSPEEEEEIRREHKFIRPPEEDGESADSWATRIAKKYYQRLFKEYEYGCIGTRWRTEDEVKRGKGHFICASTTCDADTDLGTYEMNFSYSEDKVKKQALVKVRVCPNCAQKMNYKRSMLKESIKAELDKKSRKRKKTGTTSKSLKRHKSGQEKSKRERKDAREDKLLDGLFL